VKKNQQTKTKCSINRRNFRHENGFLKITISERIKYEVVTRALKIKSQIISVSIHLLTGKAITNS
jgi:hypothetical protein